MLEMVEGRTPVRRPTHSWSGVVDHQGRNVGMGEAKRTTVFNRFDHFIGNFSAGVLFGVGEIRWCDGRRQLSSFGMHTKATSEYEHSEGPTEFKYPNGDALRCTASKNIRQGPAMYTFSNGDVRYGTFDDDKWHGTALHIYQDGRKELQTWMKGVLKSSKSGVAM
jgi:hypothetical protein